MSWPTGLSTPAGEEEAAGGLLLSAAGQRDTRKEVCHHPEGADAAGPTSGRDKMGGESDTWCLLYVVAYHSCCG